MAGPEHGILRVLRNGRPVGLAFHVGEGLLLTCAHVVNTAQGRPKREWQRPEAVELAVDFALAGRLPARPAVLRWWAPEAADDFDERDVAVLALLAPPPPDLVVLRLVEGDAGDFEVRAFGPSPERRTGGFVSGRFLGAVDGGRFQVNQRLEGIFRIGAGFSGGPVWRTDTGEVVGALQAAAVEDEATDAYAISAVVLRRALDAARAQPGPGAPARRSPRPAEVSVLHLADLRFGIDHGVAGADVTGAGHRYGGPAGRLLEDLGRLREREGVTPDLVVVAGDIAQSAIPKEYEAAYAFLDDLALGLGLSRDRIVLVPGSSDVNRKKCQAYFLDREAVDEEPVKPYWAKWEPYAKLVERFHGRALPPDEPWSYVEFDDLGLIVAGLNSTMAESHRESDHYGWVGEDQLRWFAERLGHGIRHGGQLGWLRLAVLHHSPLRGAHGHDASLRDADRFGAVLAPHLHAVVHGQPRGSLVTWTGAHARPVLGTGSAGTLPGQRPAGVPDQYQIVQLAPDGVRLWARRFDPHYQRWIGDTTLSEDGDDWRRHVPLGPLGFPGVHSAFQPMPDRMVDALKERREWRRTAGPRPAESLLERIAEVYRLRNPQARVEEAGSGSDERYLRVSCHRAIDPDRPLMVETFPIGAVHGPVTREHIVRFHQRIDARFRGSGAAVGSKLVYEGEPAPAGLRELAQRKGIELLSFAEFQLGYDLRPYATWQAEQLVSDLVYPSRLYISQRYCELGATDVRLDLLADLRGWLADPEGHFALVLGPFGHGKTFLLYELARRMHAEDDPAVPVLVHLRDLEKTHQLDQLVAAQLTVGGHRRIDMPLFRYLLREGRIALLFDGYDELAQRVTYQRATEHLNTVIQATEGRAKVVLTSRDHYFLTDADIMSALGDRLAVISGRRVVKLCGFSEKEILKFLTNLLGDAEAAARRLRLLRDVRDLLGLSHNPRMLSFIGRIDEERLVDAHRRVGEITAAALYHELLDQWIEYEWRRLGEPKSPSRKEMWLAVGDLAARMWRAPGEQLGLADLQETAETLAKLTPTVDEGAPTVEKGAPTVAEAAQLFGSSTLLTRDAGGMFRFEHRSVLEWLVARDCAARLGDGDARPEPLTRSMSPLMVEFLVDLAGRQAAERWARTVLATSPDGLATSENAEKVRKRLGAEVHGARLAKQDLRGADLTGEDLRGADLRGADLTEATLAGADLTEADLTGATLVRARLDQARLAGAQLRDADLTGARMVRADLTGAVLAGARLRRAALVDARVTRAQLDQADLTGAAPPDGTGAQRQVRAAAAAFNAAAFAPDGGLLATGASSGAVTLWDAATGAPVRELSGHTGPVWAVAWAPDGSLVASASGAVIALWPVPAPARRPTVELLAFGSGGWAAFGDGWHKVSGTVNGEFWYVINQCRFEPGVLGPEREGSRPLPLDAPLPGLA
ncbi:MAG TPA: pentapeptide repeat-containing protein [Micromonosporaceae bacterium]|nr:pentapeptide repeat-containing protein [Micromonosporaceae bacterium]